MKRTSGSLILALFITLCTLSSASAQTWQWGVSGGCLFNPLDEPEHFYDMATDTHGNVYIAASVGNSVSARLGNMPLATYGSPAVTAPNILLASYACDGSLRWHKLIGGDGACAARSLRVDDEGHVYLMGNVDYVQAYPPLPPVRIHFGQDTSLPYDLYKRMFIVQYDSMGTYQWLQMPDADTVTVASWARTAGYDMEMDADGNLNVIAFLAKGALPGTAWTVQSNGLYILKYDKQGTLVSAIQPPGFNFDAYNGPNGSLTGFANVAFESIRMGRTPSGDWVIHGQQYAPPPPGFSINGQWVDKPAFVAGFSNQWQHLWHHTAESNAALFRGRPVSDASGNIYITGAVLSDGHLLNDTIHTPSTGYVPFVAKLSSGGVPQWLSYAASNEVSVGGCNASTLGQGIALNSGGEPVVTGGAVGLKWGPQSLAGKCDSGYRVFMARLDPASGTALSLDTLKKMPEKDNFGLAIAAGKNNNIYVGGEMANTHFAGNDTMLYIGGYTDFFVARYGKACQEDTVTAIGNAVAASDEIRIWPNPAAAYFMLESPVRGEAVLSDMTGRRVMTQHIVSGSQTIRLDNMTPGVYILSFIQPDGARQSFRVLKQ
jgi:hypothetical protein